MPEPMYTKLAAAKGPKCGHKAPGRTGRTPLYCIKPKGHDGRHLHDVKP